MQAMNISQIKKIIYEEITNVLIDLENPYMLTESVYYSLLTEGDLQGEPLTPNELRDLLRKKVVNFEFIKLNGEQRPAKGTLRMDMIPQNKHPKGIRPSNKQKTVTYFDLDRDDWRSVSTKTKGVVLQDIDGKEASVIITDEPEDNQVKIEDTPKDDEVIIKDEPSETDSEVLIKEPEIEEEPEEAPIEEPSEEMPIEEPIEGELDVSDTEEPEEAPIEEPSEEDTQNDVEIQKTDDGDNIVKVNKELKKPIPKSGLKIGKDGKGTYRVGKTIPNKKGYVKNGTYRNPIKIRINGKKDLDRLKKSKFGKDTSEIEKEVRLENPKINNPYETKPLTNKEKMDISTDSIDTTNDIKQDVDLDDKDIEAVKDAKFESYNINLSRLNSLVEDMKQKINMLK